MKIPEQKDTCNDRRIILLEDKNDNTIQQLLSILCSPLGLAKELSNRAFDTDNKGNLLSYEKQLDFLKRAGAGLTSASKKGPYPISDYASFLFAFQQFFHSSYRARQGNFAESLVRTILTLSNKGKVYTKKQHAKVMSMILPLRTKSKHDMDVIASLSGKYLFVQIRSRDDTGGTTAKGSLVEFLKDVIRNNNIPNYPIRYVIFVWISGSSTQKSTLISKIAEQLTNLGGINPEEIKEKLTSSEMVSLAKNITMELIYGFEDFSRILGDFSGSSEITEISEKIFKTLEDWDDLWLTYVVTSIEIQNLKIHGKNNFQILEEKLSEEGIIISSESITDYKKESCNIALLLMKKWKEASLPVSSPGDQFLYIRDLVLIKMISLVAYETTVKPKQKRKPRKKKSESDNEDNTDNGEGEPT